MKHWYIIHTQTGLEERTKAFLDGRITVKGMQESISKVVIPTEQISEIRSGKKKISQRKFFPGYLMIEMELNDETLLFIKTTPGITGFIGLGKKPTPLTQDEVDNILKRSEETRIKPSPKTMFDKGEQIRVNEGPFVNFNGTIEDIYPDKGKLKVNILIFGRSTPVELEYWQVEKI